VVRDGTALVFSGLAHNGRGVATTLPSRCCLASAAAIVVAIVNVELHSFVLCSSSTSTFYHPHWHQTLDRLCLLNDAACYRLLRSSLLPLLIPQTVTAGIITKAVLAISVCGIVIIVAFAN